MGAASPPMAPTTSTLIQLAVGDALVRASLAHWCLALLGEPADARTPAPGLSGRLRAPLAWRVVNQADAAAPLFEQPSHPWSLQGQCGLLFRDPPVFGDARLWRLAHRRSALDASLLARLGIEGLLLPGTDGEFVEALFGSGDTRAQWLAALHASATTLGLPVREVNADTFRQTNWFGDR